MHSEVSGKVSKRATKAPKYPTWEHPEGSGIKIAEMPNRTGGQVYGTFFQVRIPGELLGKVGGRELRQFKTKADAQTFAEDRLVALRKHGTSFAEIPPAAQKQAVVAWGMLKEHGIDFVRAAEVAIRQLRPRGGAKKLADVMAELRASKAGRLKDKTLDKSTHDDFRSRTLKIEAALGETPVNLITADELAAWLKKIRSGGADGSGRPLTARSVLNYRNALSEVFRYAKAKGFCSDNPMEQFTREDYKALGGEQSTRSIDAINILTAEEAEKLLRTAEANPRTGLLPSLVLRLFCGVRTKEVCHLDWREVHWTEPKPYVHIPAGKAKKRRIRHIDIPENALAWLKLCNPPAAGSLVPVPPATKDKERSYGKRFARLVAKAGISEWENNDTRHSYGSYHYALYGDAIKTAAQLGHKQDDTELFAHYRQLVRKEHAEAYFALRPSGSDAKVTPFPAAAVSA